MHARAAELIAGLQLSPHTEGGYFREIHRSPSLVDPRDGRARRSALTSIYFLLVSGGVSRWHRVASDETWHFLEGHPLQLHDADAAFESVITTTIGPYDELAQPAHVIVAGSWQAARSMGDYTLVGCTVGPGFDYADFALLEDFPHEAESLKRKHPHLASFV
jgi:hypothetical protein